MKYLPLALSIFLFTFPAYASSQLAVTATGAQLSNGSTAVTQSSGDNSTDVATDAFVQTAVSGGLGGGGMVLLATVNASGASSVTFGSSYITSTYSKYVIEFDSVYVSHDSGTLDLLFSSNDGSSYVSTYYYGTSSSNTPSSGASFPIITVDSGPTGCGSSCGNGAQGTIKFSNPSEGYMNFMSTASSPYNFGGGITALIVEPETYGFVPSSSAMNALKIVELNGYTITGNFHLYGLSGT
jgi:hypothetical protein